MTDEKPAEEADENSNVEATSLSPVAQALTQMPVTPLAPEEKPFGDSVEELRSALIPEILERHPGLTRQELEEMMEEMNI